MSFKCFNVFRQRGLLREYQQLDEKDLLKGFRTEKWKSLDNHEKCALLQAVENKNAIKQERTPCKVIIDDNMGYKKYGAFTSDNVIRINTTPMRSGKYSKDPKMDNINNSYNILDTLYHEGEHAFQEHCIKKKLEPPKGLPKETRDMCELENCRGIYKETISYDNCTCEIDSNTAAAKKMAEHKDIFYDEHYYNEYLRDKKDELEKFHRELNSAARKEEQNNAVEKASRRGEIAPQKSEDIKESLKREEPVMIESQQAIRELEAARRESVQKFYESKQEKSTEPAQAINENKEGSISTEETMEEQQERGRRRR